MTLKTILVHLDGSSNAQARVAAAAALARQHDAHLVGVAPTGWIVLPADGPGMLGLAEYQQAAMDQLREQADQCVSQFLEQALSLGVRSYEGRAELGNASEVMSLAARYSDLIVATQPNPDEPRSEQSTQMPQDVLLRAGRPLLLLPYVGECEVASAARVLVGWNGSREAARAMHDALPLLKMAASVEVAVFDAPEDVDRRHGELPGADIALWLARHGLNVKVSYVPIKVGAGEALLSHAADMGAQLIVTGGYGHSRLRETVLGGVTRTLMSSSPVPVLLSH
ncbi:MAG: universal stress protein [Burkholderiales bacterium]|nr:universal stress protein [Burkholderiales bacterium]